METATKNLENDHSYILRLIDVMEQMVLTVSTKISHLEMVVRLIREYADGYHHAKEENQLFPLLVKKGFSNEQGPVSVMLNDHAEGRRFVKGMATEIDNVKQGDESALTMVYEYMQSYIDLLRAHIGKENNVLFRMADKTLSPEEQEDLLKEFAAIGEKSYSEERIQRFITDIEGLEAIYMNR
jgi:hemerythrin-like domain-containing protein